jgi:hypothetical protein
MENPRIVKSQWVLVSRILGTVGIVFMALTAYLEFHYADACPQAPDEIVGRVHVLNVHGRIVYLNTMERDKLYLCEAAALAAGLGFAASVTLSLRRNEV